MLTNPFTKVRVGTFNQEKALREGSFPALMWALLPPPAASAARPTRNLILNTTQLCIHLLMSDTGRKIDPTPVSVNFIPDTFGPISDQEIRYVLF